MEQYNTDQIWVGLDVHQSSTAVAIPHGDAHDPEIVRMTSNLNAVRRLFRRLSKHGVTRHCEIACSSEPGSTTPSFLGREAVRPVRALHP